MNDIKQQIASHMPALTRIAHNLYDNKGIEVADLVQETLYKVIKHSDKYKPRRGVKLMTWLTRIMFNEKMSALRKKNLLKNSREINDSAEYVNFRKSCDRNQGEMALLTEDIAGKIYGLKNDKSRRDCVLRFVHGYKLKDIAEITGDKEGPPVAALRAE